jgi:hypothetical protein
MEIQKKDKIQDISKDNVMTSENLFLKFRTISLQIIRLKDMLGWSIEHPSTITLKQFTSEMTDQSFHIGKIIVVWQDKEVAHEQCVRAVQHREWVFAGRAERRCAKTERRPETDLRRHELTANVLLRMNATTHIPSQWIEFRLFQQACDLMVRRKGVY